MTPTGVPPCVTATNVYNSIQAAVKAAPAGTTISVCPGTYAEQVTITKSLTLIGIPNGSTYPTVVAPAGGIIPTYTTTEVFPYTASLQDGLPVAAQIAAVGAGCNVNIENLVVDGTNNGLTTFTAHLFGVFYQNTSGTISNVHVQDETTPSTPGVESGDGIFVESGAGGSSNVAVTGDTVIDCQNNGITASGVKTTVQTTGNWVGTNYTTPSTTFVPNGIVYELAAGSICNNTINNLSTNPAAFGGVASGGIIVVASCNKTISGNTITNVDAPIVTISVGVPTPSIPGVTGDADSAQISNNHIIGTNWVYKVANVVTSIADGIDVCSNAANISWNSIANTQNSGVHLDSSCTATYGGNTGNNSFVESNTVNTTCAGFAEGGHSNSVFFNSISNAQFAVFNGDFCGIAGADSYGNFNLLDILSGTGGYGKPSCPKLIPPVYKKHC